MWSMKCQGSVRWAFNFRDWKPTCQEWTLAARCVQPEENERIHRFVFAEDSKASMIGQLLIRKVVSENTGIPYDEVQLSRSETGKPYVSSHPEILKNINYNFNVSHHGSMCVLAAEQGLHLGIDVMKVEYRGFRSVPEYFNLMQKQFSSAEWDFITCPVLEKDQLQRFYRLWCLKESYVKAKGTGISYNLRNLSFDCTTPQLKENVTVTDTKLFVEGSLESSWLFEETMLDKDHCAAVALETGSKDAFEESANGGTKRDPLVFTTLKYQDIMKNVQPFVSLNDNFWQIFCKKSEKPC